MWFSLYTPLKADAYKAENLNADVRLLATDYVYVEVSPETKATLASLAGPEHFFNAAEAVQEPGQDLVSVIRQFELEHGLLATRDRLFAPNPHGFNVINHGDTWFNNFLFCHEESAEGEQTPKRACLLDVSGTRYTSPAVDLAYFMYSSVTPLLRETHLDALLGHYHDTFMRCLVQLGDDPAIYPYRYIPVYIGSIRIIRKKVSVIRK